MIAASLRLLAVVTLWLAFPMVALAHDPPESGVTRQYILAAGALIGGACAAAALALSKAHERLNKALTRPARRDRKLTTQGPWFANQDAADVPNYHTRTGGPEKKK